ncbi:LytR C-terminal domain-containing protein [Schaalia sp. Marseille-Q2122]|uniref:LytR C-terminal domain-containing protein n=1 Tax=Schaalia sp. Marseille-Q2122 TaxID=2736604 RepID=UPI00158D4B23|nr:LytR C-terminal domain-containing protein [Schaalia sp. Marseille-Q2122]
MSSQYPKDEFDLAGEDMPVGMHRPQPSRWKNVIPFLVILVAVPVLGWGASQLLTSSSTVTAQSDVPTVSDQLQSQPQSDAMVEAPQSEPAPAPAPEPAQDQPQSEPQSQAAQINHNVAITVLNGTDTQGLAASKAGTLNEAGFPGTTAANADGWESQVSTVYYESPQVEATAHEIARILGIDAVAVNTTDLGNADVVVLLR